MTEQIQTSSSQPATTDSPPLSAGSGASDSPGLPQRAAALADQRPELVAGAAFAGGLLFAIILKRVAR